MFIKLVEITGWVSPMVLVKKKTDKLRVCVDYRKLNACTQKNHFPKIIHHITLRGGRSACLLHIHGWLCRLQSNFHSNTRCSQYDVHHSLGHFCMGGHAIWIV